MSDTAILVVAILCVVLSAYGVVRYTRGDGSWFWSIIAGAGMVCWIFVGGIALGNIIR